MFYDRCEIFKFVQHFSAMLIMNYGVTTVAKYQAGCNLVFWSRRERI